MNIPNTLAPYILLSLTKDLYNTSPLACRVRDLDSWEYLDKPIPPALVEAIRQGQVRTDARWLDGPEVWLVQLLNAALYEMKGPTEGVSIKKYDRVSPLTFKTSDEFIAEAERIRSYYGSQEIIEIDDLGNTSTVDDVARGDFVHLCKVANNSLWLPWAHERLRGAGIL